MMGKEQELRPCGGCGNADPDKRCIGCMHPFLSKADKCCALCGVRVYALWVADEPHTVGCSDGLDATPWLCSHVLNSLAMAVMRVDHLDGKLMPHHKQIISVIGQDRADEIFAHVRKYKRPPKAGNRKEPNYARPSIQ